MVAFGIRFLPNKIFVVKNDVDNFHCRKHREKKNATKIAGFKGEN
jgi:hypothetical protein